MLKNLEIVESRVRKPGKSFECALSPAAHVGTPEMATPWPCLEQQLFSIFTAVILWRDGLSEVLDSFLIVGQDLLCTFFCSKGKL